MKKAGSLLKNIIKKLANILASQNINIMLLISYIIILIMDCNFVYSQYIPDIIFQIPKYCIAAFFISKIFLVSWKHFTQKTKIALTIIFVLLLIQALVGKDSTLMQVFILSIGCHDVSFNKILKFVLISESATLGIIIMLALTGVIPNWIYDRYEGGFTRQSLGLQYPTYVAIATTAFTATYLYYRKKRIKWLEYIALLILNVLCYIATNTRAMLVWSVILIIAFICISHNLHERLHLTKPILFLTKFLIIICAIVAITSTIEYNPENKVCAHINYALSSRLSLGKRAIDTYGINFFGNNVEWIGSSLIHENTNNGKKFNIVDSFYVRTLVAYGIVGFLIVILAIEKTMLRAQRKKNFYLITILSFLILQAVFDQYIIQIQWNIFALLFFQSFISIRPQPEQKYKNILEHSTKKLLSIILPVYNAQKYLKQCIHQLELIKGINYEIIIINDGSTDETANIAKKLKTHSQNIILINNHNNLGVSHARNIGIKKAKGDYIICVDVDDQINPLMYELLLKNASATNADISMCDYYEVESGSKYVNSKYTYQQELLKSKRILQEYLLDHISNNVWDKMINKKTFANIFFNETLHIGEDILYCLEIFNKANIVSQIPDELLGYVQNPNSVMHNLSPKFTEYKNVLEQVPPELQNKLQKEYPREFTFFNLEMIVRGIHAISLSTNKNNFNQSLEMLSQYYTQKNLKDIISNKNFSKTIRIEMAILALLGPKVHLRLMPLYQQIRKVVR